MEYSPERELKLAATPDFRMPSIYGLAGPIVRQAPRERNDTTYFDTDDLRLARWGASLRYRPSEGWTVKLPAERDAPFLVRPEIVFEGSGDAPPAASLELVRGFVRREPLHPSVRMITLRRRTGLHGADGRLIAAVVDDSVSVLNGSNPSSFRELEVEIGEEMTPGLLDALVERLRQAGAGAPDQTAKYIRALAPRTPLAPEVAVTDVGADAPAGAVVRRAIAHSVIRLIVHDPVVRLDADIEGVHQARVATRRLRSDLRTFRPLLERPWSEALRDELGWIARILGDVRDGDVLLARLRKLAEELPSGDREAAAAVLSALQEVRDTAHAQLLETLRGHRYLALLDRLVEGANMPALAAAADAPASEVVPELVRRPWHKLDKRARRLDEQPTDEQLHDIRIRTKRVRYAAEAVAPVVGKPARAFARSAASLQDVLGDLNDAVVAARWLVVWAARAGTTRGSPRRQCAGCSRARDRSRPAAALASRLGGAVGPGPSRLDVTETVLAAGGLVLRRQDGVDEVLVVHRPAYDDWSFPKGKLEPGEREEDAAVREVEEETGLSCRLEREIATTSYRDARGRSKTVRYWLMSPVAGDLAAANEVDDARFVPLAEARALLTYARDVELLSKVEETE